MKKYYDRQHHRLVYLHTQANSSFWDNQWQSPRLKEKILADSRNPFYVHITRRYLPVINPAPKILEGGCGQGAVVLSLLQAGYKSEGIDFAHKTITKVNQIFPNLPLQTGDVTKLPYSSNYFDGYWSLGVIEHDYNGFTALIHEAHRVLKSNGYLFLTFPYMSFTRKTKAALGLYPDWHASSTNLSNFYQFALDHLQTLNEITKFGFVVKAGNPIDGYKGFQEEIPISQPLIKLIKRLPRPLPYALSTLLTPVSGHIYLAVFQKQ